MNYLFDTNAVINLISGNGDFSNLSEDDNYFFSFITKIELFTGIKNQEEEKHVQKFTEYAKMILIDDRIIYKTIDIRKNTGLKLPDALVAATAIEQNATIITSDLEMIRKLTTLEINVLNPVDSGW